MNRLHDFISAKKLSYLPKYRVRFERLYRSRWPNVIGIEWTDHDQHYQVCGIDVILSLQDGQRITLDEKVRELKTKPGEWNYADFLCEYVSDVRKHKPGWTVDASKHPTYIAYAIEFVSSCWLLPAKRLRQAALDHQQEWTARTGIRDARNENSTTRQQWVTRNVPVPWREIASALQCREVDLKYPW